MKMTQCERGHFYDQERSAVCPYCNPGSNTVNRTVAMMSPSSSDDMGFTMPINDDIGKTVAVISGKAGNIGNSTDPGKTVAIFAKKKNFKTDPVVGWLVATNGSHKGEDYKIHSDNNFIGRSDNMDISLQDDETISRENHAILSYDTRTGKFFLSPSGGRAIIRVNGMPIYNIVELSDYDKLEIGETILVFRSLCGENFTWED